MSRGTWDVRDDLHTARIASMERPASYYDAVQHRARSKEQGAIPVPVYTS